MISIIILTLKSQKYSVYSLLNFDTKWVITLTMTEYMYLKYLSVSSDLHSVLTSFVRTSKILDSFGL